MAAKNPISNLVDAILDNRASGRGNMGMGMGAGPAQMAQMEMAFAEGQQMARGGRMNMAAMGPAMMNGQGQAFINDFAGPQAMRPQAAGVSLELFLHLMYSPHHCFGAPGKLGRRVPSGAHGGRPCTF
jgi:hypothetical protein